MKLPTIIHHPYEFLCPVSGQLMIYPVLCEDGDSCEKEFVGDKTHINNHTLRSVILGYRVRTAKYYLEELSDFFESNDIPDIKKNLPDSENIMSHIVALSKPLETEVYIKEIELKFNQMSKRLEEIARNKMSEKLEDIEKYYESLEALSEKMDVIQKKYEESASLAKNPQDEEENQKEYIADISKAHEDYEITFQALQRAMEISRSSGEKVVTTPAVTISNQEKLKIEKDQLIAKAEEIKLGIHPEEFICSISRELMLDPVTTQAGHSYERKDITRWLDMRKTDPYTGSDLTNENLVSNNFLAIAIHSYRESIVLTSKRTAYQLTDIGEYEAAKNLLEYSDAITAGNPDLKKSLELCQNRNSAFAIASGSPLNQNDHPNEEEQRLLMESFLIYDPTLSSTKDRDGDTLLHLAAQTMNQNICELLIERGADILSTDNSGNTPLNLAEKMLEEAKKNLETTSGKERYQKTEFFVNFLREKTEEKIKIGEQQPNPKASLNHSVGERLKESVQNKSLDF